MHWYFQRHSRMKDLILNIEMKRIPQIQISYVLPTEEPQQNNKIIVCVCQAQG